MSVLLPASPAPIAATPRPVDGGSWQQPIGGGTTIRIDRPNADHLAVDVNTKRLTMQDARIWLFLLVQNLGRVVRYRLPQPDIIVGNPGGTMVDGAGQTGEMIAIRGGAPGYVIRMGQAFNVYDSAGRTYLHLCGADVAIGGDGRAALPTSPGLRAFPADGSAFTLIDPVIEGRLIGAEKGLTLKRALADGLTFSIEENR